MFIVINLGFNISIAQFNVCFSFLLTFTMKKFWRLILKFLSSSNNHQICKKNMIWVEWIMKNNFTMLFSEFRFYVVQLLTINNINRKRTVIVFFLLLTWLWKFLERVGLLMGMFSFFEFFISLEKLLIKPDDFDEG